MIWYLLYPLRGTTEAPVLPPSHPLRNGFARYGRQASRLAITTLVVSAAIATILIYPIPFLFTTDFINGASNLPHHVWTVAQPLAHDMSAEPDLIMRSIWIHASYMQALHAQILSSALDLQDELLGSTQDFGPSKAAGAALPEPDDIILTLAQRDALHAVNGLTNQSWIFQSPLLYWNCSRERILADTNILATVNNKKNQSTPANITLRHSIVFSGKRFEDRRLLAADALVITLLHLSDSPVGRQWENMAPSLPKKVGDKWDIYPPDGQVSASQLYEFQFRPMSLQDSIVLSVAYGLTLIYFFMSLSKLRAVKSKIGLIVTVLTQIIFSIMSSFTVCAIFNLDLSRIPRAAYPVVILSMSLENIFRLINAVILTPSEENTSSRIGHAFGETAHIALTSTLQNVIILAGLSRLVSPGVSAFCIFAAIAIVFDFFFLSTFFLSVLSVDVRRMELGDAFTKESVRHNRNKLETRSGPTWLRQALHGKIALSTRIAGTIVMVGFVLIAQWHFFGGDDVFQQVLRLCRGMDRAHSIRKSKTSLLEDIHQARSPTSWLRLQDHETAQEVIRIIKPSAYSYTARVYEPLVFVLKGSDRMPHSKEPTLLPAAYDFIHHQLARFVVVVVVVVAALRLLTSFLLWEDETKSDDQIGMETPTLSVRTLSMGHSLDIAMLINSPGGHIVSVGLDRIIRVLDVRKGDASYAINATEIGPEHLFPIIAGAIDDTSRWLALLSATQVNFWDLENHEWAPPVAVVKTGRKSEAIFIDNTRSLELPTVVIVWRDGSLTEIEQHLAQCQEFELWPKLACARSLIYKESGPLPGQLFVLAASRQGSVSVATRTGSSWQIQTISGKGLKDANIHQVIPLSPLPHFLAASADSVYLINASNGYVAHVFQTEDMRPRSLDCVFSCHHSSQSRATALIFFTLCYRRAEGRDCILHHFVPPDGDDAICIGPGEDDMIDRKGSWKAARETKKYVNNAGVWGLTNDGGAVGVRQQLFVDHNGRDALPNLRNRFPTRKRWHHVTQRWEVWRTMSGGRSEINEAMSLLTENDEDDHLLITELGPQSRVGLMSVAFVFGNLIKLVTAGGRERFDFGLTETNGKGLVTNLNSRRRKPVATNRARSPS